MSLRSTMAVMRMFARMTGRVPASHLWYLLRRMRFEKPHRFAGQTRINTFFPPYPSLAFDRFCEGVVQRKRVPYSVYVAVTGACPYHCEHCSYRGRPIDAPTRDDLLDWVRQIKSLGTATLGLTGGEPLLRDDLEDVIAAAGPEMATVLFTTGLGLDAARAQRLVRAGLTCVTIGIELANAARHDAVRGSAGSFAQAEAAARACREAGLYLAISTVATREKMGRPREGIPAEAVEEAIDVEEMPAEATSDLQAMYDLGARWGAGEFRILAPVATGAWRGCGAVMLSPDERAQLARFHLDHNRRPDGPAVACFAYLESDELFGCGAGFHHLFIDATGNACPCDLTPLGFGNLREQPLASIWEQMNEYFPRPRRGCLMGEIGCHVSDTFSLPLSPRESRELCSRVTKGGVLPEGYRRLY
jgi:MoaA/NifB/PqqE/SkfB family radical SAM enzyme